MTRNPHTPDCSIDGCTRAGYRASLCRHHYGMIPYDVKMSAAVAMIIRTHEAGKAHAAAMRAEVEKLVSA